MSEIPAETLAALAACVAAVQEQLAENRSHNAKQFAENRSHNAKQFAELRDMMRSLKVTMQKTLGKSSAQSQPLLPTPQNVSLMAPYQSLNAQAAAVKPTDQAVNSKPTLAPEEHFQEKEQTNTSILLPTNDIPQINGDKVTEWPAFTRDRVALFGPSIYWRDKVSLNKLCLSSSSVDAYVGEFEAMSTRTPGLTTFIHFGVNIHMKCFGVFSLPRPPEFPTLRTRFSEEGRNVTPWG